jgi:hypothetical protein
MPNYRTALVLSRGRPTLFHTSGLIANLFKQRDRSWKWKFLNYRSRRGAF